jgi:hypothetical protein
VTNGSWSMTRPIEHFDGIGDPYVELYHQVRFRVCAGPVCAWAPGDSVQNRVTSRTTKFAV